MRVLTVAHVAEEIDEIIGTQPNHNESLFFKIHMLGFIAVNLPGLFNVIPSIDKEISSHCVTHRIRRDVVEQSIDVSHTNTGLAVQHLVKQTGE